MAYRPDPSEFDNPLTQAELKELHRRLSLLKSSPRPGGVPDGSSALLHDRRSSTQGGGGAGDGRGLEDTEEVEGAEIIDKALMG